MLATPALAKPRPRNRENDGAQTPELFAGRFQRKRAQAAEVREKTERRAEKTARRKAEQVKTPEDDAS